MVTPSFSIGTTTPPTTARRSTRRAALIAATRIAGDLAPQRRSTRLASINNIQTSDTWSLDGGPSLATSSASTTVATASDGASAMTELPPVPKGSPIVLDDDDTEGMDLKPAAKVPVSEVAAALLPVQMADFTCAICLDAPPTMTDVASISGCTHKFCFDCIDKWANTENRCPCCKARFRTIDRVVALPPIPVEVPEATATATGGRRGKRKRSSNGASSLSPNSRRRSDGNNAGASSPDHPNRRLNSRTVEDRNQPSMTMGIAIDAAFVQNILASLVNVTGGGGEGVAVGRGGAGGQVTLGTSEDGRPVIRVVNPQGGGMVGIMEIYMSEGALAQLNGGASSAGMSVRVSRAPTSNDSRRIPRRSDMPHMRPVTSELLQQMAAGRSPAGGAEAASSSVAAASSDQPAPTTGENTNRVPSRASVHTSSFANFFAGRRDSVRGTTSSPRGRRGGFSVGGSNANGTADGSLASNSRQVMTIRLIPRPSNASDSTRESDSPPTPSRNGRTASSTGDGGSTDNEPIVID